MLRKTKTIYLSEDELLHLLKPFKRTAKHLQMWRNEKHEEDRLRYMIKGNTRYYSLAVVQQLFSRDEMPEIPQEWADEIGATPEELEYKEPYEKTEWPEMDQIIKRYQEGATLKTLYQEFHHNIEDISDRLKSSGVWVDRNKEKREDKKQRLKKIGLGVLDVGLSNYISEDPAARKHVKFRLAQHYGFRYRHPNAYHVGRKEIERFYEDRLREAMERKGDL